MRVGEHEHGKINIGLHSLNTAHYGPNALEDKRNNTVT